MTGFIHSNGWVYMLTCNNSLDCFVVPPRNDGGRYCNDGGRYCNDGQRVSSLRACEAIQEKRSATALQKPVTGNRRSGGFCNDGAVSLDCFVVPPRNDGGRYNNDEGRYCNDEGRYRNDGGTLSSLRYRLPSLRACEAIQKQQQKQQQKR